MLGSSVPADSAIDNAPELSVSIVVPILEDPSVLDLFFTSLLGTVPDGTQLVLVDDGCNADARGVLHRWSTASEHSLDVIVLHHSHPLGDGAAFNAGLERCTNDVVIRLDSDTILPKPWLSQLVEPLLLENVAAVSGILLYPQTGGINHAGLTFFEFVGRHLFLNARPNYLPDSPYAVQAMTLGFGAIKRNLLEDLHGFDRSFHSGYDDLDLTLRLGLTSKTLLIAPAARAFHWERSAGPHRDSGRKRNLALFWHRWGASIVDDLWLYLGPRLRTEIGRIEVPGDEVLLGIDLCGDRIGAQSFWQMLPDQVELRISEVRALAHRCPGAQPISLPLVLGSGAHHEVRRMLCLTDNFVRLLGNSYFFDRRSVVRTDDIVVDLHGNVLRLLDLASQSWPGEKVR